MILCYQCFKLLLKSFKKHTDYYKIKCRQVHIAIGKPKDLLEKKITKIIYIGVKDNSLNLISDWSLSNYPLIIH